MGSSSWEVWILALTLCLNLGNVPHLDEPVFLLDNGSVCRLVSLKTKCVLELRGERSHKYNPGLKPAQSGSAGTAS